MSIVTPNPAPIVNPMLSGAIPTNFLPYSDITAFTVRTGMSHMHLLEALRAYIVDTLTPGVNDGFALMSDSWEEQVTTLISAVQNFVDAESAANAQKIQDALTSIANADIIITDPAVVAVLNATTSATRDWLEAHFLTQAKADGLYAPVALGSTLVQGPGFDPTGATESTAALQTFLNNAIDGGTYVIPAGVIYTVKTGIEITKRIRLTGAGELRWIGAEDAMLRVRAEGARIDGLYLTNPAAAPVSAVFVYANNVQITGNRIIGFRDGICVSELGEYYGTIIAYNHVLDIIGSGTGPVNGDWSSGESNGDGIVSWGAGTVIIGNRVSAKDGKDARIGIHVESIPRYVTAGFSPDSFATIQGNIVSGPFRRAITTEGVQHAAITGNTIHGPRFWGINAVGLCHHSIIAHNTIKWTSTDRSNGYFRCGILLYCIQEAMTNINVMGNTIRAAVGSNIDYGIIVNYDPSVAALGIQHSSISGNHIEDESNTLGEGVHVSVASDSLEITDNRVYRFGGKGVMVNTGTRVTVSRNHLYGRGTAAGVIGISLEGGAADAEVDHNTVRDLETGIRAYFRGEMLSISGNKIRSGTTGIDLYGAQPGLVASLRGNLLYSVGTALVNAPQGVTLA